MSSEPVRFPTDRREDPLSGLIYAALVVIWAAVLVPMWVRRHDTVSESRSVDRFSNAMRILSRRTSASGAARYAVVPRRPAEATGQWIETPQRSASASASAGARGRARGRSSLVRRRRRTLLGLVVLTVVTGMAAALGRLPWYVQVAADLVVVGYLVHLRRQAALARQRRLRARGRAAVAPTAAQPGVEWPAAADAPAEQPAPAAAAAAAAAASDGVSGVAATALSAAEVEHDGRRPVAADGTWTPTPWPLPTYVTKPPAPRVVDLTWTESPLLDDPDEPDELPDEDELTEIIRRRRAVGS